MLISLWEDFYYILQKEGIIVSELGRYHEGTELNQVGYIFEGKAQHNLGFRYMVTHIENETVFLINDDQIGLNIKENNKYKLVGKLTFEELNL